MQHGIIGTQTMPTFPTQDGLGEQELPKLHSLPRRLGGKLIHWEFPEKKGERTILLILSGASLGKPTETELVQSQILLPCAPRLGGWWQGLCGEHLHSYARRAPRCMQNLPKFTQTPHLQAPGAAWGLWGDPWQGAGPGAGNPAVRAPACAPVPALQHLFLVCVHVSDGADPAGQPLPASICQTPQQRVAPRHEQPATGAAPTSTSVMQRLAAQLLASLPTAPAAPPENGAPSSPPK